MTDIHARAEVVSSKRSRPYRIGVLTPSSNTVLEPTLQAMLKSVPDVTCHFARFRVTKISLEPQDLGQFNQSSILEAARLLSDAQVDLIVWTGTSGSWLGSEVDRALCAAVKSETGAPATTSTLAVEDALQILKARRIGLVTPYAADVQHRIVENYQAQGISCVAERHLADHGNFSFADWSEETVAEMIRDVAVARPDAIAVMCTNFRGASVVERMEKETGIPVLDSVSASVWQCLKILGVTSTALRSWGRLFEVDR